LTAPAPISFDRLGDPALGWTHGLHQPSQEAAHVGSPPAIQDPLKGKAAGSVLAPMMNDPTPPREPAAAHRKAAIHLFYKDFSVERRDFAAQKT